MVDGTHALSIRQFGKTATGSFPDWRAQIVFDPNYMPGDPAAKQGHVTVNVAISSLQLGSVSQQALGYDFFNAADFPTALFDADIMPANDGYRATGTLTIKGHSTPLTLLFGLSIKGNTVQMNTKIILNRLDFGIGANLPDESSLGFQVTVNVALRARRI